MPIATGHMLECPGTLTPSRMRRVLILLSIGATVCFAAPSVQALGFGKVGSPTLLGQPLDFSATVHLDADEALERRCVSAEVMSGENKLGADQIRVTLQAGADPGMRTVRVTTLRMIDEPVVTVNVTVGCTSSLSRKFVTFLDPPLVNLAGAAATDSVAQAAEPQRIESQVAPLVAMLRPARAATRPSVSAPRASGRAAARAHGRFATAARIGRSTRLSAAEQATTRAERRPVSVARATLRPASGGAPRLQLEVASPVVARAPEAAASAATLVATPTALALVASDPDALALRAALDSERERIKVLETGLARLRADAQSTQKSVAALQARLREAEGERYTNPLVYLLGGLCAFLVAVSALALRRKPHKGVSRWWAPTPLPPAPVAVPPHAAVDIAADDTTDDLSWTYQPSRLPVMTALAGPRDGPVSSIGGLEVTTVIDPALFARMAADHPAANGPLNPDGYAAPRDLTMESLIDLDQQAEFFVVLGQDEAAIELLSRHLRGGSVSPLPFFRLLAIHRRRAEEAAYARVAEAFHHQFGACAPVWDAAFEPGRTLEDYPQAMTRLERLWATPSDAMGAIDSWLFRRQPADEMLDFGACRDLVFVYSVLRELSEPESADDIDLLLPMDGPAIDLTPVNLVAPSNFAALYALPSRPAALDLDISASPIEGGSELRQAI